MAEPIPLLPLRFDPIAGRWSHEAGPVAVAGRAALTVATWNVWFGAEHRAERARALFAALEAADADVIGLQEMTPEVLQALLEAPWVRTRYAVSDAGGATVEPYGEVLLSRLPLRRLTLHPLPTLMGRGLLLGEVEAPGGVVGIGTAHLESHSENATFRLRQLDAVWPILRAAAPEAVLMGDFNFTPDDEEERTLPRDFTDVWAHLHPELPGYTMDTEANAMLRRLKGTVEKRRRFDRVLLRSPDASRVARSIHALGTQPIAATTPEVFPSDHFGLRAELTRPG